MSIALPGKLNFLTLFKHIFFFLFVHTYDHFFFHHPWSERFSMFKFSISLMTLSIKIRSSLSLLSYNISIFSLYNLSSYENCYRLNTNLVSAQHPLSFPCMYFCVRWQNHKVRINTYKGLWLNSSTRVNEASWNLMPWNVWWKYLIQGNMMSSTMKSWWGKTIWDYVHIIKLKKQAWEVRYAN